YCTLPRCCGGSRGSGSPGSHAGEALDGIVLDSGRPVLLAPQTARSNSYRKIALAWKDTAEAARALTDAMPLLEQAQSIDIFCANEPATEPNQSAESSDRILRYLRWHGFNAYTHAVTPSNRPVADALVQRVTQAGADLLIMGAYGHSRIRELVFGGFTQ